MVRNKVDLASLWNVIMTVVAGRTWYQSIFLHLCEKQTNPKVRILIEIVSKQTLKKKY